MTFLAEVSLAQSTPTPFIPRANESWIVSGSGPSSTNRQTKLYSFDVRTSTYGTGSAQLIPGSTNTTIQAVGLNVLDSFMYGSRAGTSSIVKIGSNGVAAILPVAGLPADNYTAGDVDGNGILYLYVSGASSIRKVDLKPALGPVYLSSIPLGSSTSLTDIAVTPDGSKIYGINTSNNRLYSYNTTTGARTLEPQIFSDGDASGEYNLFLDAASNKLYAQKYNTGVTYQIDLTSPSIATTYLVSAGNTTNRTDGAHFANQRLFTLTDAQPAFFCSPGVSYLFQHNTSGSSGSLPNLATIVYRLNLQEGTYSTAKNQLVPGTKYISTQNWVFNPKDDYMWGYRQQTNQLIRVGNDWSAEPVVIAGLVNLGSNGYNAGDIDTSGIMYFYRGGKGTGWSSVNGGALGYLRRVDLNPASASYLKALPDLTLTFPTSSFQNNNMYVIDWGMNPVDGNLYGVNELQQLIRIELPSGNVALVGSTGISSSNPYGAVYFDNEGTMFLSANSASSTTNQGGKIYKIPNVAVSQGANTVATELIQGPRTNQNDGARCYNSPVFIARVKGYVWNDGNGDAVKQPSEAYFNTSDEDETGMWANLVDADNLVVSSAPVALNGLFTLYAESTGSYSVILTKNEQAPGTYLDNSTIPAPWYFTGTNKNNTTAIDPANNTGMIGSVNITSLNDIIDSLYFGIQSPPSADSYSFELSSLPEPGSQLALNGSWMGTDTLLTQLTGSDYEDGDYTGNSTSSFIITSLPVITAGTSVGGVPELLYDGIPLEAGDTIPNYDQDKLVLKIVGSGYTAIEFTYQTIDQAGKTSFPATYGIKFTATPLPVNFLYFAAKALNGTAVLNWATAQEMNSRGFEIERSRDSRNWTKIGFTGSLAENGNSNTKLEYVYTDQHALPGTNYYRLKQVDIDNKYDYSEVRSVAFGNAGGDIKIYPNPARTQITLDGLNGDEQISIYNVAGKCIANFQAGGSVKTIALDQMAEGTYYLTVTGAAGKQSFKISKVR